MANSALRFVVASGPEALVLEASVSLGRQWNEWLLSFLIHRLQESLPPRALSLAVARFAHEPHGERAELERRLGIRRVELGAAVNAIELPARLATLRFESADPRLHAILVESAEQAILGVDARSALVLTVRDRVRQEVRTTLPTLEHVAKSLGMSPRLLQRKLAAESTTFQAVVTSERVSLGRELLRRNQSVLEVALALHYSDPTAFARAFRRETGLSPARFRGGAGP